MKIVVLIFKMKHTFSLGYNPEFNTDNIRLSYNSLTVPSTILEYNTYNKQEKILKQQEVLEISLIRITIHPKDYLRCT